MKKILVVAAHPDDDILGCGGTIARYAKEGHAVSLLILGEGITSRDAKRTLSRRSRELRALKQQAEKAGRLLGAREVSFGDLPDNRFDSVAILDIIKLIEKRILKTRPDTVFTHSDADLNIDHTITHRAVLTATRPAPGQFVRELYAFEVPSSTEWAFDRFPSSFRPNTFVDITATLRSKLAAMKIYENEMRPFPHPRSSKAIAALASYRGSTVGVDAAEAFELIRKIL